MAKSLRSKTKLAARRRKAHESHYAVTEAERTARISEKLLAKTKTDTEGDANMEAAEGDAEMTEGEYMREEAFRCFYGASRTAIQTPTALR